jgi:PAS domain S-box-containing protein
LTAPEGGESTRALQGSGRERQTLLNLIENLKDYAVARVDREGRVTGWNQGAARLTGYRTEDVLGTDMGEFLRTPRGGPCKVKRVLEHAHAAGGYERKGWLLRRDGSLISARSLVTPVPEDPRTSAGFLIITAGREISQNKHEADRLAAVLDIAQAILAGHDPDLLLQLIPQRARVLLRADFAAVFTPEPGGEALVLRSAAGWSSASGHDRRVPVSSSAIGRVFQSGRTRTLRRLKILPDDQDGSSWGRPVGPAVVVPLAADGRRIGLLMAGNQNRGTAFLKKDVELLRLFAGQSAIALLQAHVRKDRQRLAVMEERDRLGRELHDGAIQSLYAVTLRLATATARADDLSLKAELKAMVDQIDSVIMDLRNHIFELRPTTLAAGHLDEALTQLVRDFALRTGIATTAEMDPEVARQLSEQAHDIVQMVKEALSNAGRHARPRSCKVTLRGVGSVASLVIEDDGAGFDPGQVVPAGHGLRNLQDRVSQLGGQFGLEAAPNAGTSVRIDIPLKSPSQGAGRAPTD